MWQWKWNKKTVNAIGTRDGHYIIGYPILTYIILYFVNYTVSYIILSYTIYSLVFPIFKLYSKIWKRILDRMNLAQKLSLASNMAKGKMLLFGTPHFWLQISIMVPIWKGYCGFWAAINKATKTRFDVVLISCIV